MADDKKGGKLAEIEAIGRKNVAKVRAVAGDVLGSAPAQIGGAAAGGVAAAALDAFDVGGFEAGPVQVQAGLYVGAVIAYVGRKNALARSAGLGMVGYGSGMLYHDWMKSQVATPAPKVVEA